MLSAPTPRLRLPITGIISAEETNVERTRNRFAPGTANRKGLQFEKRFALWLAETLATFRDDPNVIGFNLKSGVWISYTDENASGDWAQPDHYLILRDRIILFECKLSEVETAWHQLDNIYGPLISHIYPDIPLLKCAVYASVRTNGKEKRISRLKELLAPINEAPFRSEWLIISQHHM